MSNRVLEFGSFVPVLFSALVCSLIIRAWLWNPLWDIPAAHWSIPLFGDTWILYQRWKGCNNAATYAAHVRKGPVVRLGRNELTVNCVENDIRTIYGGGWEKHEWYPRQFTNYGIRNMFATTGHAAHSQKKRTLANIYCKSSVAASPQIAATSKKLLYSRFLPLLQSISDSGEAADVHSTNNAFTVDFMSAYLFGLKHGTNLTQQVEVKDKILHAYT